jgi:hypothetical protein
MRPPLQHEEMELDGEGGILSLAKVSLIYQYKEGNCRAARSEKTCVK